MQNIRRGYIQCQQQSINSYQKLSKGIFQSLLKACNTQSQVMQATNDYTNISQLVFYQQKLQKIINEYDEPKSKKQLKIKIKQQLQQSYPQYQDMIHQNYHDGDGRKHVEQIVQHTLGREEKRQLTPKEVVSSFFKDKKEEVEKTRKGFDNILQDLPKVHKLQVKSSKFANDQNQLKQLKRQLQRLRQQLERQKAQAKAQQNVLLTDKKQRQKKIANLTNKIQDLKRQNFELRDISEIQHVPNYEVKVVPPNQPLKAYHQRKYNEPAMNAMNGDRYFMLNDIGAIKKKTGPPYDKHKFAQQKQQNSQLKNHPVVLKLKEIPQQFTNLFNLQGKASNIRLNRSELEDQAKNIAVRSKISYFKTSMVLYRSDTFQVAVKSSSIKPLSERKANFYVNNKSSKQLKVKFAYKYEKNYYNLTQVKKIVSVYPKQQQKQQINITLLTETDFDSVIEVELTVDSKTLHFLLPATFLQFVDKRPKQNQRVANKCESIHPIHQFSAFQLASEILPLQKVQNELYQTGRMYAVSKYHEGYIYIRWVNKKVQIDTIPQWRLFISYLMMKDL